MTDDVPIIEIVVVVFGLLLGYWMVSKLFFASSASPVRPPAAPEPPPFVETKPRWYETLEVSPAATALEIRAAYKQLISKYHPDKVDTLGQEIKDVAAHKAQEINAAYRDGMRARGQEY